MIRYYYLYPPFSGDYTVLYVHPTLSLSRALEKL